MTARRKKAIANGTARRAAGTEHVASDDSSIDESIERVIDFARKWEAAETVEAAADANGMTKRQAINFASKIRRKYGVPLRRFPAGVRKRDDAEREQVRAKLLEVIRDEHTRQTTARYLPASERDE